MAPYNVTMQPSNTARSARKLRKPVIEKMRRDRINSSIEQLRMLLEKEFENHHLPSKPEKADILEMTVRFLQQHMAGQSGETVSHSYEEGYSKCVKDSLHFLSAQDLNQQGNLLKRFQSHSRPSQQQKMVPLQLTVSKALWRPW